MNPWILVGVGAFLLLVFRGKPARSAARVVFDEDEVLVVTSGPQGAPPPPAADEQADDEQTGGGGGFTAAYGDDDPYGLGLPPLRPKPRPAVTHTLLVNPMREKLKGVSVKPGTVRESQLR